MNETSQNIANIPVHFVLSTDNKREWARSFSFADSRLNNYWNLDLSRKQRRLFGQSIEKPVHNS